MPEPPAILDFDPLHGQDRADPSEFYRRAREAPVSFSPTIGAWLVSRHADLVAVLDDTDTYSSSVAVPALYRNPPEVVAQLREQGVPETGKIVDEDGDPHRRSREVFVAGLSAARIRALLPRIRLRAHELVDAFGEPPVDLVSAYATPLVEWVADTLIGFPAPDRERVRAWTEDVRLLQNPLSPLPDRVAAATRMGGYTRYLQDLVDDRRAHPRDDLLTDLVHGAAGRPGLPDAQIHSVVRGPARIAGFDTTRDALAATVWMILDDPTVRERVLGDIDRETPHATEEALRRDTPHRGLFRITTRAAEIGGTPIPAGARLLLLFASGNRDPAVFAHPDTADLDRPGLHRSLTFGHGVHHCPGAPLARAEIRTALHTLLHRHPRLRLADDWTPTYTASYFFRELESLRVAW